MNSTGLSSSATSEKKSARTSSAITANSESSRGPRTKAEWLKPLPGKGLVYYKDSLSMVDETGLLKLLGKWLGRRVEHSGSDYLSHYLSRQDLLQEAQLALLKCWRTYQRRRLDRNETLITTYSHKSVNGAIIEHFRNRGQAKAYEEGYYTGTLSWDAPSSLIDLCFDELYPTDPPPIAENIDLTEVLLALETWERRLLNLYLAQGLTLKEIGARSNVSEGRACQIYTEVIKKVRRLLGVAYRRL